MTYILIFILAGTHKTTSVVAEFNNLEYCRAAAAEMQKQKIKATMSDSIVLCAAKGPKP